jgi:hypothetical protein
VHKMEHVLKLFNTIMDADLGHFTKVHEDKPKETPYELKIYANSVPTPDKKKIHVTRQQFKIKAQPKDFIFVSNDQEIQGRINTNLSHYKNLFVYKGENYVLELYHSKSKKILMIDSRESIFLKYCKKVTDIHYVSIGKSILLKDLGSATKELTTNIQLTGYSYKYKEENVTADLK